MRGWYRLRTFWQRADAQPCGQVWCFMQMVGGQRRVAVIPVRRTGQRLVTMRMRMSTVIATQGRLARSHKQRRGMSSPSHQYGESKGKNHLGADGIAEHVVVLSMPKRVAFLEGWSV